MVKKTLVYSLFLFVLSIIPQNNNFARSSHRRIKRYAPIIIDTTDYSKHVWGIDLSHHQGIINWNQIDKNDKPNFIFFKVTEGNNLKDTKYDQHIERARKLNIPCGAYHFFGYQSDGKSQAKHFIKNARLQKGDLHPVLDVEFTRRTKHARFNIKKEIKAFCAEIYKQFKVYPIIYCNESYYNTYLKDSFKNYNFWICNYRKAPKLNWVFWQHTDKGKVNGINGSVDKNRLNPKKKIGSYLL
jgi:lysozyme